MPGMGGRRRCSIRSSTATAPITRRATGILCVSVVNPDIPAATPRDPAVRKLFQRADLAQIARDAGVDEAGLGRSGSGVGGSRLGGLRQALRQRRLRLVEGAGEAVG